MSDAVYIETSIISYLAARPSRDLVTAGHQQTTHEWWLTERGNFSIYASPLVMREASAGDAAAASARLQWLHGIPLIAITPEAERLADCSFSEPRFRPKPPQTLCTSQLPHSIGSISCSPGTASTLPMPSNAR